MRKYSYILLFFSIVWSNLFADGGQISCKNFFEYNYQLENGHSDKNGFEIRRAYLTYRNNITKNMALKFTADVARPKDDSLNTNLFVYLKNASLTWITAYGQLIFGMQSMNLFNVQEKNWGYRFVEKSAMDKNKFGSSADLGIGYANQFSKDIYVSYLITNGSGYKKSETDAYKKLSLLFVYGNKKLNKKNGFNVGTAASYEPYKDSKTESIIIAGVFSGFAINNFRMGAELNYRTHSGNKENQYLTSVYGTYKFTGKYEIFGRIDQFSTEKDENYLITGFIYTPFKKFQIAPNYRTSWGKKSKQSYTLNFQYVF